MTEDNDSTIERTPMEAEVESAVSTAVIVRSGVPVPGDLASIPARALARPENRNLKALAAALPSVLHTYIDPKFIEKVMENLGWSLADEVDLFVTLASDETQSAKTRMAAAKEIHALAIKALLLRGDLAEVSEKRTTKDSDGSVTVERMAGIVARAQSTATSIPVTAKELPNGIRTEDAETPTEEAILEGQRLAASARGEHHAAPSNAGSRGAARGLAGNLAVDSPSEALRTDVGREARADSEGS